MILKKFLSALLAVFVSLILLSAATPAVWAEDPEAELSGLIDPEAGISDSVKEAIGGYDGAVEGFGARALELLKSTLGQIGELGLGPGLRTLGTILAAALLCALLETGTRTKAAVPVVGALTVGAACLGSFGSMISLGTETIRDLHGYTELLLPAMGTLMSLSGSPASAGLSGLGMLLFDLLQSLVSGLLVPMLYLFLGLSVAESALGLEPFGALRDFVKWLLTTAVKLLMWGYTGILTLTGLVSGAVDAQKLRNLRTAIAGMVPVVGSIVSEASSSLLSAASLLRTASGLYGMLAVLGISLEPFFEIAIQYLLLKLAGALCGLFGKGSQTPLLEKLTEGMGILLALTGISCLCSLMILVLCIRTVNP